MIKVFCSYSHRDRNLKEALEAHFASLRLAGRISDFWSDDEITAGTEFDPLIRRELEAAHIILLLLSADYFNSHYCWNIEAQAAMELHDGAKARVVPVLLRHVNWQVTPIKKYSVLPKNLTPATAWQDQDAVFRHVVEEVDRVVEEVLTTTRLRNSNPNVPPGPFPAPSQRGTPVNDEIFHCVPLFEDPVTARAAGITESLGDLVLQMRGDPGERRISDILLFANVNLTSRINTRGFSEAMLSLATSQCVTRLPTLGKAMRAKATGANALAFLHVPLHELRLLPESERNLRISGITWIRRILVPGRTSDRRID
ncbi:MAG: toll/interleukin-1 receptor domain-containing protein, partial [Acidobacteriota bacterium]